MPSGELAPLTSDIVIASVKSNLSGYLLVLNIHGSYDQESPVFLTDSVHWDDFYFYLTGVCTNWACLA